jgi:hypothetical protein
MISKIKEYKNGKIAREKMFDIFQGWHAYSR